MKDYIFENQLNCNITVEITAYSEYEAEELLATTVKYVEDYKLISVL